MRKARQNMAGNRRAHDRADLAACRCQWTYPCRMVPPCTRARGSHKRLLRDIAPRFALNVPAAVTCRHPAQADHVCAAVVSKFSCPTRTDARKRRACSSNTLLFPAGHGVDDPCSATLSNTVASASLCTCSKPPPRERVLPRILDVGRKIVNEANHSVDPVTGGEQSKFRSTRAS